MAATRQATKMQSAQTPILNNAPFPSGAKKGQGMSRRNSPSAGYSCGPSGERDYFYLNTKGICLLCYEICDPVTIEEKKRVHTQTSINFCRLISRHLGFSMEDVIASPLKTVGRKQSSKEEEDKRMYDKVAFELCERCVGLAHAFNQVYFQVQFHQMILDRCVKSVSDIIRKANKKSINELFVLSEDEEAMKSQQKTFTRLTLGGIRSAHRLRTKLFKRSLVKLSQSFPVIKLRRITKSGDWNFLLKKPENGLKNGIVPAVPTASLMTSKNSKQMLASFFVSFWIVISLSFIKLDQFVINTKKEKLIELKLERDIGVDVDTEDCYDKVVAKRMPISPRTGTAKPWLPSSTSATMEVNSIEVSPKKKRTYTKKAPKRKTEDESINPKEPVKRGRKPKLKVEVIPTLMTMKEEKTSASEAPSLSVPVTFSPNAKAKKSVVIAPPQPKPNSVQKRKVEIKEEVKDPLSSLSSMANSSSLSQFQSSQSNHTQQQGAQTIPGPVSSNSTVTELATWQPNNSIQQPKASAPPLPPPQYPLQPVMPQYAPPPTPYLPISTPQQQHSSIASASSSTPSTNQYTFTANSIQPQYNSYYSDPSGPSSSSSYQLNNPYYMPTPSPSTQTTSSILPIPEQQRRPSYNGIVGYDIDGNNPSGSSNVSGIPNNNYNYSYNNSTYNYNNANASSSWTSNHIPLDDSHQQNHSSSLTSALPPLQTSGYSFSTISGESMQSYNDYNDYGAPQLTPLDNTPRPATGIPNNSGSSSATNVGIYAYDGYGNYVLQQETSYPTYPEQSTSSLPYYNSPMLPSMAPSSSYSPALTPNADTTYNSSSNPVSEEPPPSLTYEEPPPQLHDLEEEEQQSEVEEMATEGDAESKSKSLSVFPEVHWKQKSISSKTICCKHPTCTEKFITSPQLQLHLLAHGTFTCSFCQLSFGKAHNLALHERNKHGKTGTGNKWKCPRCELHLTSSTYKYLLHFLNNHLNISVHGDPCEVCNKPFVFGTKSISKRSHFKKYHDIQGKDPETVKTCTGCDAPFLKEAQLKDHLDKMHCTASSSPDTARASSVSSTVSVTTAEEITYTTAVATASQIVS